MSDLTRRFVLVAGASGGIGAACTDHLDSLGFTVFAASRRPEAVQRKSERPARAIPLRIDVTDPQSIEAASTTISDRVGGAGLTGLVNCAGIAAFGPLEFMPVDVLRQQLEVNVLGPIAVIQAFLPQLRRGNGRIVNIGSISGLLAPPFLSPYSISKFALEAASDALRRELRRSRIHVSLVEPGRIATRIWARSAAAFDSLRPNLPPEAEAHYGTTLDFLRASAERPAGLAPEAVARAVERALTEMNPKARYIVGRDAARRLRLRWLPEQLVDWLLTRRLPGPRP